MSSLDSIILHSPFCFSFLKLNNKEVQRIPFCPNQVGRNEHHLMRPLAGSKRSSWQLHYIFDLSQGYLELTLILTLNQTNSMVPSVYHSIEMVSSMSSIMEIFKYKKSISIQMHKTYRGLLFTKYSLFKYDQLNKKSSFSE